MDMPIYAMSCFKLPKTIYSNLISAMTQYWWSSVEHLRKISWVSWKKFCLPKELGGIGFKDLELFNQALLSKQAWRILTEPSSLLSKLLKSRYLYDGEFLQAKIEVRPSFTWKSILHGRDLLVHGIDLLVGDGGQIKVWLDPWMKDKDGEFRAPWRKNVTFDVNLNVKDLLDPENKAWNRETIEDLFVPDDVEMILKIKPTLDFKDSWTWRFNKSGDFSVKSAYWLATNHSKSEIRKQAEVQPSINGLKEWVWKLQTEPKIRTFLWKALSKALPVEEGFQSRGMTVDGRCQICRLERENMNHVLFTCTVARQTWALSNIPAPENGFDSDSVYANISHLLMIGKSRLLLVEQRRVWPWIIWNIWKSRNKFLFEGDQVWSEDTVQRSLDEANMWFFALACDLNNEGIETGLEKEMLSGWRKPGDSWVKCNVGFFWSKASRLTGAAWVLRDDQGRVLLHSRRSFTNCTNVEDAKLMVVCWAIESMVAHRVSRVIFGLEDKGLVGAVNDPKRWPILRFQGASMKKSLTGIIDWKLECEQRKANLGAYLIASSVSAPHLHQSYVATGAPD